MVFKFFQTTCFNILYLFLIILQKISNNLLFLDLKISRKKAIRQNILNQEFSFLLQMN